MVVNSILRKLQKKGYTRLLNIIIFIMYKVKGKRIKGVSFIAHLDVWEFQIGNEFFYSSGPGWAYDYGYLLEQFSTHLGNQYLPKEGDIVIDVGAGVGEELMIFSKLVGKSGKVFAIEAHPKTFDALVHNNKKNGFANTILLNAGVSDAPGYLYIEDTADSLSNSVSKDHDEKGFRVEAITIEQLIEKYKLEKVDFIKVNIEGAEQLFIKGLGDKIKSIKNMAISCHDFRYKNEGNEFFKTKDIVINFLREKNMEFIVRNTGNPQLDDYIYTFTSPITK